MSGMAEVLAAHWSRSTFTNHKPHVDKCDGCGAVIHSWGDDPAWEGVEPLAAHQAAALTAAGFGPVKEVAAKALEDAADAWREYLPAVAGYGKVQPVPVWLERRAEWVRS